MNFYRIKKKIVRYLTNKSSFLFILISLFFTTGSYFVFMNTFASKLEYSSSLIASSSLLTTSKTLNVNYQYQKKCDISKLTSLCNKSFDIFHSIYATNSSYSVRTIANFNTTSNYSFSYKNNGMDEPYVFEEKTYLIPTPTNSWHYNNEPEKVNCVHNWYELRLVYGYDEGAGVSEYWDKTLASNFCYITETQAKSILNIDNISTKRIDKQDAYRSLLNSLIEVSYKRSDGSFETNNWQIINIIADDCSSSQHLRGLFGSFLLCYTNLPSFEDVSVNFDFSSSIETNKYFLKIFNDIFPTTDFKPSINASNFVNENEIDFQELSKSVHFEKNTDSFPLFCNLYVIFIGLLFSFLCFIVTRISKLRFLSIFFSITIPFFLVYYVFFFLYLNNPIISLFFNKISIITNLFFVASACISSFICSKFIRKKCFVGVIRC